MPKQHHPYNSNIVELQSNLQYQQSLFNSSKKSGACFEELKKIYMRVKELQQELQVLKSMRLT